jgi:hypothetical protein
MRGRPRMGTRIHEWRIHSCRSGFRRDLLRHRRRKARDWGKRLHPQPPGHQGRKFGAEAPPTERSAFGRSGFRRDPCATEEGRPGIGGGGFIRTLCAIEGRKFGAEAPPTKRSTFGRSGFRRDPLRHRRGKARDWGKRLHPHHFAPSKAESSGLKPLLQKDQHLVGAASAATLALSKAEGPGLGEAASSAAIGPSKAESSGLKPLLQKDRHLVGAASAATLALSKAEGPGLGEAASSAAIGPSKAESSGLKPLLQKDQHLVGAALAATFCATEDGGPGILGSGFIRSHWAIEGREFGAEAPPTKRSTFGRSGFSRDPLRHRRRKARD